MPCRSSFRVVGLLLVLMAAVRHAALSAGDERNDLAESIALHGGLCVQLGTQSLETATRLAETGRFVVQCLAPDPSAVDAARQTLRRAGVYGPVCVQQLRRNDRLPYTEDLVNLLIVEADFAKSIAISEAKRVLCPNGHLILPARTDLRKALQANGFADIREVQTNGRRLIGKKPWPVEMDEWSHPRHSASGNAVSRDTLVGPPRRVRWVVGAQAEVRGLVTSGGRNFYAAVLARDSFNGLRLWDRDLLNPKSTASLIMKNLPGNIPTPIATAHYVFGVMSGKLVALDAATGELVMEYPDAGTPGTLLHDRGTLIAISGDSVRALDVKSGQLIWRHDGAAPRNIVAGDRYVAVMQGRPKRGETAELTVIDIKTGKVLWSKSDYAWSTGVTRCVYYRGLLAYEVSTLNDNGPGNALHVLSAETGEEMWERDFLPGMNHMRQARAMFVDDQLWILHGGKGVDKQRFPIQCSALDLKTGETHLTNYAGLAHCFPPVATPRYMLAGEMDFTDLTSGEIDRHQITKAACGREYGWMPANGLTYVTPKHCVCWPMLRGYTALAAERPAGSVAEMTLDELDFALEKGPASAPANAEDAKPADWPIYRHDAWRSGSTVSDGPRQLTLLWSVSLATPHCASPISADWDENPFVKGPVTSPVIAGGIVCVARPDAHEVVALDSATGKVRWRFSADGRVDTAPTLYRGLCLFGDKAGRVYCLRADSGVVVWKRYAAPFDEQIVAYGQLESPWPVPGSVLIVDGTAYFAAGRQSLADGGIFVFAVDPVNGTQRWCQRLDTVPQKGFYLCSGLEFDNFDLLHQEGTGVGMSRWVFSRETGKMSIEPWAAFAKLNTGGGTAIVPRGCWSYAPRHQRRITSYTPQRPLAVFRDKMLIGGLQGMRSLYRRDFNVEDGETFDMKWMTGWAASKESRDGKMPWRSYRLAEKATWKTDIFKNQPDSETIHALVMDSTRLYLAGSKGTLQIRTIQDGAVVTEERLSPPLWDGLAIAEECLFMTTADGELACYGLMRQ